MSERPGLREDTGQVRGDEKDPFPILGTLCAKRGLVRISRKESKSIILHLERRTKRPGLPVGYPGPVGYPTPETLPGSPLGELSHLICYRDDIYAAVGHCLTHLVLHAGPLGEELRENHASNLFILEGKAHAAEVCGWLVRIEAHHDGEVLRVLEQYVGGDNFEILSRGDLSHDAVALAHDARVGALLFLRYVVGGYIRRLLILRDFLLYWL